MYFAFCQLLVCKAVLRLWLVLCSLCVSCIVIAQTQDTLTGYRTNDLDEVVVTALGIKHEKRVLGYAVSNVTEQSLNARPEADIARILNGQVAGLDVVGSSGITGSGTSLNIRGFSSISGGTAPLWVVDGVPFYSNAATNSESFKSGNMASSRFLDLDPNNIENIAVLKGLSATILYGELGRNGIILVTTKNSVASDNLQQSGKLNISFSQTLSFSRVANIPETQQVWGDGFDNSVEPSSVFSFLSNWGGKLSSNLLFDHPYTRSSAIFDNVRSQFLGQKYAYKNYNPLQGFFDATGFSSQTGITLSHGLGKTKISTTASYLTEQGFIETNTLKRLNLGMGLTTDMGAGWTFNGTVNIANSSYKTPPIAYSGGAGASFGYSLFGDVMYTPLSIDLMNLPYQDPITHANIYYRSTTQNPLWTMRNVSYQEETMRTYGNLGLVKKIGHLSFQYRLGIDFTSQQRINYANKGGVSTNNQPNLPLGYMTTTDMAYQIWDHLLLMEYNHTIGNFSMLATLGMNYRYTIQKENTTKSTEQNVYGLLTASNFKNYEAITNYEHFYSNGTFLQMALGYKDFVFLNLGGRHTITSVLESNHNQIFYPSISFSFLPTSIFPSLSSKNILNYTKLRIGYATSANLPRPYLTRQSGTVVSRSFITNAGNVISSGSISNRLANPDLMPELIQELEVGIEANMFHSKVFVDLTYFYKTSSNQIVDRQLDPSTGYSTQYINAGRVTNQGVELGIGYKVFSNKDWDINTHLTVYAYRNMVSDIPADIKNLVIDGFSNLGNFAENGQPINIIKGSYFLTAPDGQKIVNANTGRYQNSADIKIIGDPNPDFKLNGSLSLKYKFIELTARWDYTYGGDIYSVTAKSMLARGLAKETDIDRWQSVILKGVNQVTTNGLVTYIPNTTQLSTSSAYFNVAFNGANEIGIYDATVFRLREIAIGFSFPSTWLKKISFIKAIHVSIIGSNIFYVAPGFPSGYNIDPEINALGADRNGRGFDFLTGPTATKYALTFKLNF